MRGDVRHELDLATDAVLAAGAEVRERFGQDEDVRYKSPQQPVTDADIVADGILRERLMAASSDYGWLSEETSDSRERLDRTRVWVVDPIDGTNSFVAGLGEFVVSVGLVAEGITELAVVYNPVTGELYRAVRGSGAWLNEAPLRVRVAPASGTRPVMLGSRWEVEEGVLGRYADGWRLETMGSTAYRMAKVAEGIAHAFVSPARKYEWDLCAAALLVTEAGGVVADGAGAPLRFNRPEPVIHGIMAWSPQTEPTPPLPAE